MSWEEEAMAKTLADIIVDQREAADQREVDRLKDDKEQPDIPACDSCGKEFSANLVCSRCKSAFYCSKECQKNAWKQGGHKHLCDGMKEKCAYDAKRVVQALRRRNNEDCIAMEGGLLYALDGAGAYKMAVKEGLYDALGQLFSDDAEHVKELFHAGPPKHVWAATRTVMDSLFRGERAEGRAVKNKRFDYVDGQRIKEYVNSHPEAFDVWFHASIITILLPFDSDIWDHRGSSNSRQHVYAYRAASDLIQSWMLVWANKRASRAILLPTFADDSTETRTAAQVAKTRAYSIANRYRIVMEIAEQLGERDPTNAVASMMALCAAMVANRVHEYDIDLDFNKELKLEGLELARYEQLAVPGANATIEKGTTLTEVEGKEAVMAFAAARQSGRGR
jgi:hypothetical protein